METFIGMICWINGWEVHSRADHGFGVYDAHGLVAGPFGTKEGAMQAAMHLPCAHPRKQESPPPLSEH